MVFAWINESTTAQLPRIGSLLPILPLLVPGLATVVGWVFLLSPRAGLLNVLFRQAAGLVGVHMESGPIDIFSFYGMAFIYTTLLVPFAYIPIAHGLANLNPAYEEASRSSGAGMFQTLRKITLPAVLPSVLSGAVLAAVISITMFSVPIILAPAARTPVVSVNIYRMLVTDFPPTPEEAVALSLLMFGVVAVLLILRRWVVRRGNFGTVGGRARHESRTGVGRWRWPLRALVLGYAATTCVVPFVGLLAVSIQPFWSKDYSFKNISLDNFDEVFFGDDFAQSALRNSLVMAIVGAILVVTVVVLTLSFIRGRDDSIGSAVSGIMTFPAALPQLVIVVSLLLALGPAPFELRGKLVLLFIAYIVLYMPHALFVVDGGYGQIGNDLFEASASCGANASRTFRRVELPLIRPSLIGAWTLLFIFIMADVTAAALLSTSSAPVIGFAMLNQYEFGSYPAIAALGVVLSIVSTIVVIVARTIGRLERT